MQTATRRLLSTLLLAVVGTAVLLVSAAHAPATEPTPWPACSLLAQIPLAPR
ncbi:hypothetical protein ACG04Q_10050 [Roseateles sp. DXS20W]|uniref:Uncharacterized protein n=1 Tax=Pelomonas lactea TaxID=3299030 RepID=A0ABW7GIX8_9BURK